MARPRIWSQVENIFEDIADEREAQDAKWGEQNHPGGTGSLKLFMIPCGTMAKMCMAARELCTSRHRRNRGTWWDILAEEFFEYSECDSEIDERAELIQLAACCVARVEHIDRKAVEQA